MLICLLLLPLYAIAADPSAELVRLSTVVDLTSGKRVTTQSITIQINNRAGEKYCNISIPYSGISKISEVKGVITDTQGKKIRTLKKDAIKQRSRFSSGTFYSDQKVLEFTLKHNVYPYRISYSYKSSTSDFLSIVHWQPVLDYDVPTVDASLTIKTRASEKISIRSNLDSGGLKSGYNGIVQYTWSTAYRDLIEPDRWSPSLYEYLPMVEVVPAKFNFVTKGSLESWIEFGDWINLLIKDKQELPDKEKIMISQTIEGVSDTLEMVKLLYKRVQKETRYMNISLETGGLEPYPASYVAENKYGDCKALANYFVAELKVLGINAYYTLVNAGEEVDPIHTDFPSQQFNHVIVMVPLPKDTLWLDCTSKNPFGYVGTFIQNRLGLVIEPGKSHFERIPALTMDDVKETQEVAMRLSDSNTQHADISIYYQGVEYEDLAGLIRQTSVNLQEKVILRYYLENGFNPEHFFVDFQEDSAKIGLHISASSDLYFRKLGNQNIYSIFGLPLPDFEDAGKRRLPLNRDYPINLVDKFEISIPSSQHINQLPQTTTITNEFGAYRIDAREENNIVTITRIFQMNSGIWKLDKYPDWLQFIEDITTVEKHNIIFTEKQ